MMKTNYHVSVKTSHGYNDGGTNSTVETQFVGTDGKTTSWTKLDTLFYNNFEQGRTDKFNVQMEDVGMPCIVRFRLIHAKKKSDSWMCDYVVIGYGEQSKTFPLYTFVGDHVEIIDSDTELPQKISLDLVKAQRKKNLLKMKEVVRWNNLEKNRGLSEGLMRSCDAVQYEDLPSFMRKYSTRQSEFKRSTTYGVIVGKVKQMETSLVPLKNLESYHVFHRKLDALAQETENFLDGWDTDEGFGWQMLNGIYPLGFTACKQIPKYFNVTNADLKGLLGPGKTIESEIKAGKLYIIDYTKVYHPDNGLVHKNNKHGKPCDVAPAVCLFHVDNHGKFLPRAIQLKPNDRDYLFVSEQSDDWMLAKMYVRNAGFSIHEWIYHFLYTHGSVEPFQIAAYRCLSIAHPIYKLLRPHIRTVAAINSQARHGLVPPTSIAANGICIDAASMMKYYYKNYHLDTLNIPKVLERSGINPDNIPDYCYGQDTLKLWKIIGNYVKEIVNLFYTSNKDVIEDEELQEFAHEVAHEGFGWEDKNLRGIPDKFTTREEVIELCTIVITTSSVQHAAVNFGQYETSKYAPNYPGIMNMPPHKRGEGSMERIMQSLPDNKQIFGVIALVYALSKYSDAEEFLGEVNELWFHEEKAIKIQEKFQDELKKLDDELKVRNSKKARSYLHQLPSNVPNSIAI